MLINFYNCTDDKKMLNKKLTSTEVSTCNLYGTCSLLTPVFIMNSKPNGNYCAFDSKLYFIDETVYSGGKWLIKCSIDPLMSCHNELLNKEVLVTRSEDRTTDIPDSNLPFRANKFVKSQSFGDDVISNSTVHYLVGVI